ncbi:MAG: NAD(P)-dependent oxidoreductase [Actinomycetes bacterium]
MTAVDLTGSTILVTGVTGQVAAPLAVSLARQATVIGAARFSNPTKRTELEAAGVSCVTIDLEKGEVTDLPGDIDYVLNFAVAKTNDWDRDLDANAGGVLSLMEQVADAKAFVHCSSTAVYKPMGHHVFSEEGPYGDNHGVWEFLRTYSTAKIATEASVRWAARRFDLPSTIARLSVPYGNNGGWPAIHLEMMINGSKIPVHTDDPSTYHPIHEDDIAAMIPGLLAAASVPVTTVNWGGNDPVSIEEWCSYMADLTGLTASFEATDATIDSVMVDLSRLHNLVGSTEVHWRDGIRRMIAARHPELLD